MRAWMKDARKDCNMTMKDMANALDISESYYSMIESGARQQSIDITLASKLSSILGVSIQYIISKEEEPDPKPTSMLA